MFPRADRATQPARTWAETLRRGIDVLVAFATLRDAEPPSNGAQAPPDLTRSRASDRFRRGAGEPKGRPGRSGMPGASPGRDVANTEPSVHPHRRPVTAPVRARRPGSVRPQPQQCLTPLAARRSRRPGVPTGGAR
jgi:hypothetical protein